MKNDKEITETPAEWWRMLTGYEAIYVDACTWMSPEVGNFLEYAAPYMREAGRRFIVIPSVYRELTNCAVQKYAAQTALDLIRQYAELIQVEGVESDATTADRDFVRMFFFNHGKRRQLLITHDQQLALDIGNCCNLPETQTAGAASTAVMTLWVTGEVISFPEMFHRKDAQARARLAEMVGNSPVYMDSTALGNANAALFLQHIAAPLQNQGKKVQILQNSLHIEAGDGIAPILDEQAAFVQVVPSDSSLSETDALLGELYLSEANAELDRLVLVTDDVMRANELKNRRPRCDRFPFVDFMTINKYGYLSYLKLSDAAPASPKPRPHASYGVPMACTIGAAQEKKPSSFVPQLIGAIKSDDIEAMCSYIDKGANLRNGIITSLCQDKSNCLRVLIDKAQENIDPSCFLWWVTAFYSFADPFYLDNNDEQYELLQQLIAKSAPMEGNRDAMVQLARLVSLPAAAHERLWRIIRLAIEKGAPSKVFSSSTGETLLDIAERHKNKEMVEFLTLRAIS